jgi:hypothetical protein
MPATDLLTDGQLIDLPPEAGDVNAPRFEPRDEWLRQAPPEAQKTAMWRWFATRYENPSEPESAMPQDTEGRRVLEQGEGPFRVGEVLRERFRGTVAEPVIQELARRVEDAAGTLWARRGQDEFGG